MKNLLIALIALVSITFTSCTPDEELLEVQQDLVESNDYTVVVEIVPDWDWFMDTTHPYGVTSMLSMYEVQMSNVSGFASIYRDSLVESIDPILWQTIEDYPSSEIITENIISSEGELAVDGMIVFHTNDIDSLSGEFTYQTTNCKYNFIVRVYEGHVSVTRPALEVFAFLGSGEYTPSNDYIYQFNSEQFDNTALHSAPIKLPILNSTGNNNYAKVVFEYSGNQLSLTSDGTVWDGELMTDTTLIYVQPLPF